MRIIDLIGLLISNKTMPKHIIFEEEEYCWNSIANDYICNDHDATRLFYNQYNMSNLSSFLGKRVEIIEEEKKIPEKIDMFDYFTGYDFSGTDEDLLKHLETNFETINKSINEIIGYLQYIKNKGDE